MEYGEVIYACALSKIFNYSCKAAKTIFEKFPNLSQFFSLSKKGLEEIFGKNSKFVDAILDHKNIEEAVNKIEWTEKTM